MSVRVREINFLTSPQSEGPQESPWFFHGALALSVALALWVGLSAVIWSGRGQAAERELATQRQEREAREAEMMQAVAERATLSRQRGELRTERDALTAEMEVGRDLGTRYSDWPEVLVGLAACLPRQVWVRSLSHSPEDRTLTFEVWAPGEREVVALVDALDSEAWCEAVVQVEAEPAESDQHLGRVRGTLDLRLAPRRREVAL